MKILVILFLLSSFSFAQEVVKVKGKKFIMKKGNLDLNVGSVYNFSNDGGKVKVKVLKLTGSKALMGLYSGSVNTGDSLSLLGSSSRKSSRKRSYSKAGHKTHRLIFGLAYLMAGQWEETDPNDSAIVLNTIDSVSAPALSIGYEYHLKSKLSFGILFKYSMGGSVFSSTGVLNLPAPGATTNLWSANFTQIVPTIGYNIMDNLRISLGYGVTSFSVAADDQGSVAQGLAQEVSLGGTGIHVGLSYDYFFNKKWGIRPHFTYDMVSYSEVEAAANGTTATGVLTNNSSQTIMGIGINAIMGF